MGRLLPSAKAEMLHEGLDDCVVKRSRHLFILGYIPFEFDVTRCTDWEHMIIILATPKSPGKDVMMRGGLPFIAPRAGYDGSHNSS